jgi:hypothetical protein
MECAEVQKQLSAYIEKAVSPKQKALIEAHLKGCKRCKQALADLKKTVDYVQRLEEVEPPPWLTQRVMARVRSEAEAKQGMWRRLFFPFHIKVPLEALALILVAVGAVYIFKTVQPEMQIAQAPIEQKEAVSPQRAPGSEEGHDVAEERDFPAEQAEQFRYADKEKTGERKPVGLAKAPVEKPKPEEAAPSAGAVPTDGLERGVALSSAEFEKSAMAEKRDEGVHFSVIVTDLDNASRDIEGTVQQLGGRIIESESIVDKTVVTVEIDSKKVKELLDQLNLIGEVQEKGMDLQAHEGTVLATIELTEMSKNP